MIPRLPLFEHTPPPALDADELVYFAPNHDGSSFHNPWGVNPNALGTDIVRWQLEGNPFAAEKRHQPALPSAHHPLGGWNSLPEGCRVMWLGHASVLIELDGVRLLIDPLFWNSAMVMRRAAPAPFTPEQLPEIDAVLITHGHLDHLDHRSLRALDKRFGAALTWLVPEGLDAALPGEIEQVQTLAWWQGVELRGLRVSLVPAQHWHQRGIGDYNRALWGSFVIEGSRRIFNSGDTGYFAGYRAIHQVFGDFDLVILPLGGYFPQWALHPQHIDPGQAVDIWQDLHASDLLGVHWGTFDLSREPLDHGPRRLHEVVSERGLPPERFHVLAHGGSLALSTRQSGAPTQSIYTRDAVLHGRVARPQTIFDGLARAELHAALQLLRTYTAEAEEILLNRDDPPGSALYLLSGQVRVERESTLLSRVSAGELVGEFSLFTNASRSADVIAELPSDFVLISRAAYDSLRAQGHRLAHNLERKVLADTCRHLEDSSRRVSSVAEPDRASPSDTLGWLKHMFANLLPEHHEAPGNATALVDSHIFADASEQAVRELLGLMRPQQFRQGELLCVQGAIEDHSYFLLSGTVEVSLCTDHHHGKDRAKRLDTLGPGRSVGVVSTLIHHPRTASCEATSPVESLVLDRATALRLFERDDAVGSALRVAMIREAIAAILFSVPLLLEPTG